MSRTEKLKKLANAIRAYRGINRGGKWVHAPRAHAVLGVIAWINRLQLDLKKSVAAIDGFKTTGEMAAWFKQIDNPSYPATAQAAAAETGKHFTAYGSFAGPDVLLPSVGETAEYNLQFMPPGEQDITCWVNEEPRKLKFTVTAKLAEKFNAQLQGIIARAQAGDGDKPLTDYNHEDAAASSRPVKIEWGGTDPKTGGIRLIGKWTSKAKAAIRDEEFDRFSPQWDFDNETGEPLKITTNLGGLVNKAAFKTIARVQAKDASEAAPAVEDEKDCDQLSAAAHKCSGKACLADDEDAVNAHTAAHKAHLTAAAAMKTAGRPDEAAAHKSLAAIHKTKVMDITKSNLAVASATASSANPPVKPGLTEENTMTETEIATAVAKGVEAANVTLVANIKKLDEKVTALETNSTAQAKAAAEANAKTAVAKYVGKSIAPQDTAAIAFWEKAHVACAKDAEEQLAKLPVIVRGRVIPVTTITATGAAAEVDPDNRVVAQARELRTKNPTAYASDAAALEAYLRTPEGNAAYAESLTNRSANRRDVATAR